MLGKLFEVAQGYTRNWFLWLEQVDKVAFIALLKSVAAKTLDYRLYKCLLNTKYKKNKKLNNKRLKNTIYVY